MVKKINKDQDYIIDEFEGGPGRGPVILFSENHKDSYYSYIGIFPDTAPYHKQDLYLFYYSAVYYFL
jgi:hypothetical protein